MHGLPGRNQTTLYLSACQKYLMNFEGMLLEEYTSYVDVHEGNFEDC